MTQRVWLKLVCLEHSQELISHKPGLFILMEFVEMGAW